jgi:signal transduction histidine kinase
VLVLAAAYGLFRTTTRELALARQQAEFVSAVSHEFRTPLTSMRHLTDLLANRGVTSDERRRHYNELLAHETERLHRMVESLLSFGRIDAGAHPWRMGTVDLRAVVDGVLGEFRRDPIGRGREVACDLDSDLPPVEGDAEALGRAIWNLLENAAKYSTPGTPIRIVARREGGAVLVGVIDRGAGIPPAERDRIFQRFVRGAEARRTGIRGLGIGLALVKLIVDAHGGSIDLESEPGRGSTFTLKLPAREPG